MTEYEACGYYSVDGFRTILAADSPTGAQEYGVQLPADVGAPGQLVKVTAHSTGKIYWNVLVAAILAHEKYGVTWTIDRAPKEQIPDDAQPAPKSASRPIRQPSAAPTTETIPGADVSARLNKAATVIRDLMGRVEVLERDVSTMAERLGALEAGRAEPTPDGMPF